MCEVDEYVVMRYLAMAITAKDLTVFTATNGGEDIYHNIVLSHIESEELGSASEYAEKHWPAREWMTYSHQKDLVSWKSLARKASCDTDRFEVALWQRVNGEQHLVGLALGTPSNARKHLTIKWLDIRVGLSYTRRKPLPVILDCAEQYARLLGCNRVLIRQPNDSLVFKQYGYEPYHHDGVPHGGNYLSSMELNNV